MKGFCPRYDMWVMSYFGHIANILNIPSICQNKGFFISWRDAFIVRQPNWPHFLHCYIQLWPEYVSRKWQLSFANSIFIEVNGEICLLNVTLKEEKLDTLHFLLVQFSLLFCLEIFILTYFCQSDSYKSNLLDTCLKNEWSVCKKNFVSRSNVGKNECSTSHLHCIVLNVNHYWILLFGIVRYFCYSYVIYNM